MYDRRYVCSIGGFEKGTGEIFQVTLRYNLLPVFLEYDIPRFSVNWKECEIWVKHAWKGSWS